MDVSKILSELKAERAQIEEAILSLEQLARPKRRGGSPGSKTPPDDLPPSAAPAVCGVRIPRPKPKLPPAAAAAHLPLPQEAH
jgi:hypothetical protein